jgi:hypothetical protein
LISASPSSLSSGPPSAGIEALFKLTRGLFRSGSCSPRIDDSLNRLELLEVEDGRLLFPNKLLKLLGPPMIGCLDIYGNPYGVSGAEDNHNDLSHNNTSDDNSYNSSYDDTSYNSSYNNDSSNNSFYDDDYKTSYDNDNNSY